MGVCPPLDGGTELWKAKVGEPWDPNGYSGPRCSPTIDGDLVYAIGTHGDLVCLKVADGQEVWRRNLPNDFGGKMHSGWGYSESPLVDGDKLVCTPGGPEAGIVALDKKTGAEIWRGAIPQHRRSRQRRSRLCLDRHQPRRRRETIRPAHGPRRGRRRGRERQVSLGLQPRRQRHGQHPHAAGPRRLCLLLDRLRHRRRAAWSSSRSTAACRPTKSIFSKRKELQNHHGGMVMIGDYVYLGHGHNKCEPTCLEWKTGKVVWRRLTGQGTGPAT